MIFPISCLLNIIKIATVGKIIMNAADTRIGTLINESNWFELKRTMEVTPHDSVSPLLYRMGTAMTAHYFNRPDSACIAIGTVLNEHQEEIGGQNSVNMAALMATNLTRCTRYEEAAALMQSLAEQLQTQGVDTATIAAIRKAADVYAMYAHESPLCRQLHPANTTSPSRSTTTCTRDTRSRDTS